MCSGDLLNVFSTAPLQYCIVKEHLLNTRERNSTKPLVNVKCSRQKTVMKIKSYGTKSYFACFANFGNSCTPATCNNRHEQ